MSNATQIQLQHWAEDRLGEVIAVHVVCLVTLVAAVTLRFYAQSFVTNPWKHADNWLTLAAAIFATGIAGCMLKALDYGFGKHTVMIRWLPFTVLLDLASPLLGLSQKDFSSLAASITMIVHNGATVSFLQPYASLRAANVTSTREPICVATPRRIPFHYVSTAGVAELTNLSSLREKSVAEHIPPTGASGYTTSKWASEVVLENASASYKIPVTVHRPSTVVEAAGKPDDVLPHDALGTLLRFSREVRAVPLPKKWTGCFDIVPVDQVAQHIVEEALLPSTGGIRYKHIAGSKKVSAQDLNKFVATQIQDPVEVMPMEDWIDRAKAHGLRKI
ncbi:unnamed protein product [Alternaria alternata]